MTTTTLSQLAATDRISDRAYTTLRGWCDELRQADLDQLRPSRPDADVDGDRHRLTPREKLRYLAAVACWDAPLETVPEVVSGMIGRGDLDPFTCWQILVGDDCRFRGTERAVTGTLPWADRREVGIRRLRLVVTARLEGDRRPSATVAADPDCGRVSHRTVARLSNVLDTSGADLQAHAAAAYTFVESGAPGGVRAFAADRGIGSKLATSLVRDARETYDDVAAIA